MLMSLMGLLTVAAGIDPRWLLREGAIVSPQRNVLVVRDVVTTAVPLDTLAGIPDRLRSLKSEVAELAAPFKEFSGYVYFQECMSRLDWQVDVIRNSVDDILIDFPIATQINEVPRPTRNRRGLFDVGGKIIGNIFGLATEGDLRIMNARFRKITDHIQQQDRFINLDHQLIGKLEKSLGKTQVTLNSLIAQSKMSWENSYAFQKFVFIYTQYQAIIHYLNDIHKRVISFSQSLVEASQGHVTTTLLPLHNLELIIRKAIEAHSLTPIFQIDNLLPYYSFIEVSFDQSKVLVHIPFTHNDFYTHYILHPFPSVFNSSLFMAKLSHTEILLSKDNMTFGVVPTSDLDTACRFSTSHLLHVCPAYLFFFHRVTEASCEVNIITNSSKASSCAFTKVPDMTGYVHFRANHFHFFYFFVNTIVMIMCNDMSPVQAKVVGLYTLPDFCSVTTTQFETLPTLIHKLHVTLHHPHMVKLPTLNISLANLSIHQPHIHALKLINDTLHPYHAFINETLSPLTTYDDIWLNPFMMHAPLLVVVFVFIVVISFMCLCMKRMAMRLEVLEKGK